MKIILRSFILILLLAVSGIIVLGISKSTYDVDFQTEIYGNQEKVFSYAASHLWKKPIFKDITSEGTTIEPFQKGHESSIIYGPNKHKVYREKYLEIDSFSYLKWEQTFPDYTVNSTIQFEKKYKTVKLVSKEKIFISNYYLRIMVFLSPKQVTQMRKGFYTSLKVLIESYPDKTIVPEQTKNYK